MKKSAIVIDIDNCWMDSRLWLSNVPMWSKNEADWEIFYRKVYLCKPNKPFINDIMTMIIDREVYPIFVTSRSEQVKKSTIFQIQNNSSLIINETCSLYMRRANIDYRSSDAVKRDILQELMNEYNILYVIDDDMKNLKMFKELGIPTVIRYDINSNDYERL